MSWRGNRRQPRRPGESGQQSEPTYLVERDAPSGPPMDPSVRWYRRAVERLRGPSYDAYPDRIEVPWHVVGPVGPTVPVDRIQRRLPKPRTHDIALFVKRHGKLREVKLMGSSLEIVLHPRNRKLVAGWVMEEIFNTLAQMEEDEDDVEGHILERSRPR